jgi:hypothetical protein
LYGTAGLGANVSIADVNGDGKPDMLAAGCNFKDCFTGVVTVRTGNGDGTFAGGTYVFGTGGMFPSSPAVADLNGDGKRDLVVANCGNGCQTGIGTVGVLLGNGDATFQTAVTYGTGGIGAHSVKIADVNGDGKTDLVVANSCASSGSSCSIGPGSVGVLLGNGDGTFQPVVNYGSGGTVVLALAVADVNGDGKPDLLDVSFIYNTVGVLIGNGDGTFQGVTTYDPGGILPQSIAVADLNGDGKPDVAVANFCGSSPNCLPGKLGVLLNNTADTTPPVITLSTTPKVLWPPNGKMVPVTVSGTITDTGSGVNVNSAAYAVKDEYGEVQPQGAITLGPGGAYSFTILLQASRLGTDLDGRRYTVTVRAKDNAGNGGSKTSVVTVPHDQGD